MSLEGRREMVSLGQEAGAIGRYRVVEPADHESVVEGGDAASP